MRKMASGLTSRHTRPSRKVARVYHPSLNLLPDHTRQHSSPLPRQLLHHIHRQLHSILDAQPAHQQCLRRIHLPSRALMHPRLAVTLPGHQRHLPPDPTLGCQSVHSNHGNLLSPLRGEFPICSTFADDSSPSKIKAMAIACSRAFAKSLASRTLF